MADSRTPGPTATFAPGPVPSQTVDQTALDNCAREPIQFLGSVQSFGCLLVLSNDWIVQNASANTADVLGLDPAAIVATRLIEHLPPDAMHLLRGKVQMLGRGDNGVQIFGADLFDDGRLFDVAVHRCDGLFLFDFERAHANRGRHDPSITAALLTRVQQAGDVTAMCDIAVNGIWAMTGFDRVMLYRFEPDFSGVVIAEALGAGAESYIGHRFPAADIPPQARALYTRSLQRIIADVDAPVYPLIPDHARDGRPVDLSLSVTRAVSPIHLQYLRNMGVGASMSVSILRDGKLWGMVACHHPRPHYVDYEIRSAIEMFCRLLSYELALAENHQQQDQTNRAYDLHERLSMLGASGSDPASDLSDLANGINGVIPVDGVAMISDGLYRSDGLSPTEAEFQVLVRHLARSGAGQVYATEHVAAAFPGVIADDRDIGGLLAVPIRRQPAEYVLLLRREVTRTVDWAGPPEKQITPDGRLSPRQSFSTWREEVRGHSQAWSVGDLRAAEVLRVTLLKLVLKQTSDTSSRDQRRSQQQEVLIAELNHRMRNVFGLINGLIGRGAENEDVTTEVFADEMRARVGALARAHDGLTDITKAVQTVCEVISDEVSAFAGNSTHQLRFSGGDAVVKPSARSTVALVLHELVTNAAKYGALSVPEGEVDVRVFSGARNALHLVWTERNGPPVTAPSRSGFGSTLLARAIPHELDGTANINFDPTGVVAEFCIPPEQVERFQDAPRVGEPAVVTAAEIDGLVATSDGRALARALVVEDNLLIAMNASDSLRALGVTDVVIVGSVSAALERVAKGNFDFAILDLDLGGVLSTPVAEALRAAGIPFLLATGYDAGAGDEPAFRDVPLLRKPYSNEAISLALSTAGLLQPKS